MPTSCHFRNCQSASGLVFALKALQQAWSFTARIRTICFSNLQSPTSDLLIFPADFILAALWRRTDAFDWLLLVFAVRRFVSCCLYIFSYPLFSIVVIGPTVESVSDGRCSELFVINSKVVFDFSCRLWLCNKTWFPCNTTQHNGYHWRKELRSQVYAT